MRRLLVGAVAGTLATVPMTAVMMAGHRELPRDQRFPLPPREITQELIRKSPLPRPSNATTRRLSLLAHFAYGAATGALYAAVAAKDKHPVAIGSVYGVGIWAVSYLGWIPAFRILRPGNEHPVQRRRLMLLAHLVWGSATGLVITWLGSRRS